MTGGRQRLVTLDAPVRLELLATVTNALLDDWGDLELRPNMIVDFDDDSRHVWVLEVHGRPAFAAAAELLEDGPVRDAPEPEPAPEPAVDVEPTLQVVDHEDRTDAPDPAVLAPRLTCQYGDHGTFDTPQQRAGHEQWCTDNPHGRRRGVGSGGRAVSRLEPDHDDEEEDGPDPLATPAGPAMPPAGPMERRPFDPEAARLRAAEGI